MYKIITRYPDGSVYEDRLVEWRTVLAFMNSEPSQAGTKFEIEKLND